MIEAAMVLPILILIIFSMILLMMHDYNCHRNQIKLHEDLLQTWDQSNKIFDIEMGETETITHISGAVDLDAERMKKGRIYIFSAAEWIRIGEMLSFDEE